MFFTHLTNETYRHSDADSIFICGDLNARIGDKLDHISEIDDIPPRKNIDHTVNQHGNSLLDFVKDTKFCLLNGRLCPENDNFTFLSTRGRSVVDYIMTPHVCLDMCKTFKVLTCNEIINRYNLQHLINTRSKASDHSMICAEFVCIYNTNVTTEETVSVNNVSNNNDILYNNKMYNFKDKPEGFLDNPEWKTQLESIIHKLENNVHNQRMLDSVFKELCECFFSEFDKNLKFRTIGNKRTRKYYKSHKPYWDEELTNNWKAMRENELKYSKYKGKFRFIKQRLLLEFKEQQHIFDKTLRKKEREYNRKQILSFDEINSNNPKEFWDKLKQLGPARKNRIPMKVRKDNKLITDEKEVLNTWKGDFEELYNGPVTENDQFIEEIKNKTQQAELSEPNEEINGNITIEEVRRAVHKLKNGKSTGIDCIQNECLKQEEILQVLWKLLYTCFDKSIVPSVWLKAIISPIPKCSKKDPYTPLNYRGISLLSNVSKTYTSILNNRINNYCENHNLIADEQNGFRKNRSCTDHIFSLNTIIRNRLNNNLPTFCAFIDFEKAFDWVNRDLILFRLQQYKINGKVYKAINSLYSKTWSCIRLNSTYSDYFNTKSGVRQGDNLSPTLFNIFLNDLIKEVKKLEIGININDLTVSILLYADDIALITANENDLQSLITCVSNWCKKWKLKVNIGKTKIVHFRPKKFKQTEFQFKYGDEHIEIVSKYKYLGIIFDEHLTFNNCIETLSEAGGRALGSIISKFKTLKDCTFNTYDKLFNTGVTPILDYSAGVWGYKDRKSIDDTQLRAIRFFLGVHKFTPILGLEGEIGWTHSTIRRHKAMISLWNRYIGMDPNRLTKKLFEYDYNINNKNWTSEIHIILRNTGQEEMFLSKSHCDIQDTEKKLKDHYEETWKINLNNKTKLRTYTIFKESFHTEQYLKLNLSKCERSTLAQFRLGVLPLEIETGRYKRVHNNNGSTRRLEVSERICKMCQDNEVEDEKHFLLECSKYSIERISLLTEASTIEPNFDHLDSNAKLNFLMKNCIKSIAKFLYTAWNKRKKSVMV